MLRMRNKYCSNCLATERFLDLGTHLVCERCSKRLEVVPAGGAGDARGDSSGGAGRPEGRLLVWAEPVEERREAC